MLEATLTASLMFFEDPTKPVVSPVHSIAVHSEAVWAVTGLHVRVITRSESFDS